MNEYKMKQMNFAPKAQVDYLKLGKSAFVALVLMAQIVLPLAGSACYDQKTVSLTVFKMIGSVPAAGWTFEIDGQSKTTQGTSGKTEAVYLAEGSYIVKEVPQTGFTLASATCTVTRKVVIKYDEHEGCNKHGKHEHYENISVSIGTPDIQNNQVKDINVSANDVVTCTFNNSPNPGTLVVKKVVSDGSAEASAFTLHVAGGTPDSFAGSEEGVLVSIPGNTTYQVTEDAARGYASSFSEGCSGTMTAGGGKTCTVTNTPIIPEKGSLTITKIVKNDSGIFQEVTVTPFVDFEKLEEVLVILKAMPSKKGPEINDE